MMQALKHISRRRSKTVAVTRGLLALASFGAHAQTFSPEAATGGQRYSIVPRVSISETFSDNYRLTAANEQSELISELSPGLRLSSHFGRVKGFADYSLNAIAYARNSAGSGFQNSLRASATAEAIENWAYLDVTGSISQQAVSAFGKQSVDNRLADSNRSEVSTFSASPYVRGSLGDLADYEVRLVHTTSSSDSSDAFDSTRSGGSARLSGRSRALGWSADASRQVVDHRAGRQNEVDRVSGTLSYSVNPQLVLSVQGGRESNNFASLDKQSQGTSGVGLNWTPTERTVFSANRERRSFGNSHAFRFSHRMPRSVWTFNSSRDVSSGSASPVDVSIGNNYDLYFTQFASIEPDPIKREQLVNDFLQANGISATDNDLISFLTSALSVQRGQSMSFALLGLRDTLTFSASRSESRRLDDLALVVDDFSSSGVIRRQGLSLSLAHRLTPQSSLNLTFARAVTKGSLATQGTSLRSVNLSWSTKIGNRTNLSLGARRARFESSTSPYSELALNAVLSMRF